MVTLRERRKGDDGSVMSLERVFVHASTAPPCCSMTRSLYFSLCVCVENVLWNHNNNKVLLVFILFYFIFREG